MIEPGTDESASQTTSFSILNREPKRITIESLRSSCGCTVAGPLSTTVLAPGQALIVPISVSSSSAEKTAHVLVRTSSKTTPDLNVELRIAGRR